MIRSEAEARAWISRHSSAENCTIGQLEELVALLQAENRNQNLVSARSLDEVWVRHIADSAQLERFVPRETRTWLDLGTGAGFPGLVLAVLRPSSSFSLIEARTRRCEWLERVAEALDLTNVEVICAKLEHVITTKFDAISARAFAPLDRLIPLAARFSTKHTVWVLPKGRSGAQELASLAGWHHQFHVEQSLTDAEASIIVGTLNDRTGQNDPRSHR
jgi:16S rRNA (guanine527-N7)-methyltransferase